jgi:16S rRNA (uracil1498-N3)-methyltransferase
MSERFFTETPLQAGGTVTLDEAEARHLVQVLRHVPGDEVIVFDGRGSEADCRIASSSKRGATLEVLSVRTTERDGPPRLTIATAVPKGDRFRWLVEKATELGVDRLVPLSTERSVVDPRETKLDRMRQAVVAACKQCRRNRLMDVSPTVTMAQFLAKPDAAAAMAVAHPGGRIAGEWLGSVPSNRPVTVLIGPEGGLTEDEVARAINAGAQRIALGTHILRIETAVIAVAAVTMLRPRG